MPSYRYMDGVKPYKRDINELSPRVRQICIMLQEEEGWGRLNRIARKVGVSRCMVWQVARRLEVTQLSNWDKGNVLQISDSSIVA